MARKSFLLTERSKKAINNENVQTGKNYTLNL